MLNADFQLTLRTLCHVFPCVELFYFPPKSIFMIASRRPLFDRPGLSQADAAEAGTYSALAPYGIDDRAALLSRWTAGGTGLRRVLGDGPISTWDRLILDYRPYKSSFAQRARSKFDNLLVMLAAGKVSPDGPPPSLRTDNAFAESSGLIRRAYSLYFGGKPAAAIPLVERAVTVNPKDRAARSILRVMRAQGAAAGGT